MFASTIGDSVLCTAWYCGFQRILVNCHVFCNSFTWTSCQFGNVHSAAVPSVHEVIHNVKSLEKSMFVISLQQENKTNSGGTMLYIAQLGKMLASTSVCYPILVFSKCITCERNALFENASIYSQTHLVCKNRLTAAKLLNQSHLSWIFSSNFFPAPLKSHSITVPSSCLDMTDWSNGPQWTPMHLDLKSISSWVRM